MTDQALVDRLRLGDHMCWTFDDDATHLSAVAGFARGGLAHGHKVVLLTEALLPDAVAAGLEYLGVPITAARASGQIEVRSAADAYLTGGVFEPAGALHSLAGLESAARAQGWAGLRLVVDMAWAAHPVPGGEHLSWYEARVNCFYASGYAMGVCLYDRRLFTAGEIDRVCSAHPGTGGTGSHGRWSPLLRMRRTTSPVGLRLSGEADLSTRHALTAVLAGLFDEHSGDDGPLTIDMSELDFADGATAALLIRAGKAAPGGVRLVGCSPPLVRLLELVAGELPSSVVVEDAR